MTNANPEATTMFTRAMSAAVRNIVADNRAMQLQLSAAGVDGMAADDETNDANRRFAFAAADAIDFELDAREWPDNLPTDAEVEAMAAVMGETVPF